MEHICLMGSTHASFSGSAKKVVSGNPKLQTTNRLCFGERRHLRLHWWTRKLFTEELRAVKPNMLLATVYTVRERVADWQTLIWWLTTEVYIKQNHVKVFWSLILLLKSTLNISDMKNSISNSTTCLFSDISDISSSERSQNSGKKVRTQINVSHVALILFRTICFEIKFTECYTKQKETPQKDALYMTQEHCIITKKKVVGLLLYRMFTYIVTALKVQNTFYGVWSVVTFLQGHTDVWKDLWDVVRRWGGRGWCDTGDVSVEQPYH